ncbi:MAG: glycosyltransferase family 2 protein [Desulfovibrionaceae bacterium]|jgi:glycosyltransferase involved in cell wall biosynthesis|nr:glycosyltransferase family 2 protein [Desulfovibrionaceae bacterium]
MKTISIVTPCYNEEGNIPALVESVRAVFAAMPGYTYEHVFADNDSTDGTLDMLRALAAEDKRIKVVANAKNFGQVRSVFNAIKHASGDAVVLLAADMEDPPALIPEFVARWERGAQVVFGIRRSRRETRYKTWFRKVYYRLLKAMSEDELINDAGEFLLFDRQILEIVKQVRDPNPYIRGMLANLTSAVDTVPYDMAYRTSGVTKTNFYRNYVYALNGFVHHATFPLRILSLAGFGLSFLSIAVALIYVLLKLFLWDHSLPGIATIIVALFFFSGVQLFFLGFIGEIVISLHNRFRDLPLVVVKELINFDSETTAADPARAEN